MSLKSMHETKKSSEGSLSSSSTELLRQQRERITELEGQIINLQQQLSEAKRIGNGNLASATAAAEKKITELQSELQKRKQKEQQLSEEIVRLLNRLESLSNSDLQLKEAEQKLAAAKVQNEESQRNLTAARNSNVAADRKVAAAMAYGFLVTIFTAVSSKTFTSDFLAFFEAVWAGTTWAWKKLLLGASWGAGVANYIPQEIVATILYWVILVVLVGVALVIAGAILIATIGKVFEFYQYAGDGYDRGTSFADNITLAELLVSLAALVFFAEPIRNIAPINLILLLILVHAAYIGVRWYVMGSKRARGYY